MHQTLDTPASSQLHVDMEPLGSLDEAIGLINQFNVVDMWTTHQLYLANQ